MFNVDVIALVSYDQTRFTDEGLASLAYWTLIGAYVVPGEKNTTHTMMDAVLYDIDSRQLLFRAPGTSAVKSSATPINLEATLREDALAGFDAASEDLIANLKLQLKRFQQRIKDAPEEVQLARRDGSAAAGSPAGVAFVALLGLMAARRRRTR